MRRLNRRLNLNILAHGSLSRVLMHASPSLGDFLRTAWNESPSIILAIL